MQGWGVDGCKAGWFFVGLDGATAEYGAVPDLGDVVDRAAPGAAIFVDIPIGLRDTGPDPRQCDREARRVLSPYRTSSVFPAPARAAAYAPDYETAARLNRESLGKGLPRQSWTICPKIREVDALLQSHPELRTRVRECHPEVCFWGLTGHPMRHPKRIREGYHERLAALTAVYPGAPDLVGRAYVHHGDFEAHRDDILDAMVLAVCAVRINECKTLPYEPEVDSTGLRMEMMYSGPERPGPA